MRIKYACIRFHNADSAIESLQGVELPFTVGEYSGQIQPQVLRVQLRREAVAHTVLLTSRDLHIVSRRGQISDNARAFWVDVRCPETAADEVDSDWGGLVVADGEDGLGWVAVDELDAEDFGGREGC